MTAPKICSDAGSEQRFAGRVLMRLGGGASCGFSVVISMISEYCCEKSCQYRLQATTGTPRAISTAAPAQRAATEQSCSSGLTVVDAR